MDEKDNWKPEYLAINPNGQVPAMQIEHPNGDKITLIQSIAIIQYLEETYPDLPKLLPTEPVARAKIRAIADVIASGIQPLQNLGPLEKVKELGFDSIEWGRYFIERGFKGLEAMLTETAGKYCYGDKITLADVCLVPQVYNANRFHVDMSQFPVISRIEQLLLTHEAFASSHPSNQVDFPGAKDPTMVHELLK